MIKLFCNMFKSRQDFKSLTAVYAVLLKDKTFNGSKRYLINFK